MAAPQKENGFTGIAHEILEAVMVRGFSAQELRVLLALWRETYGWHRDSAPFSLGLIERMTGIPRSRGSKILANLLRLNVVEKLFDSTRTSAARYRFQKDYDRWGVSPQGIPPGDTGSVAHDTGGVSPTTLIKDKVKDKQQQGVPSEDTPPTEGHLPDLASKLERQLVQLQPSGLSQEDRKTLAELMRNTDKTHRRLLEAVTDAVRQTQTERRNKQLSAPVRYALRIAGRLLSEPEPVVQVIEYHKAPEGWVSPFGTNGRSSKTDG